MRNLVRIWNFKDKAPLRHLLFVFFFFISFIALYAQHSPLYFRHLTVEDGLSSNSIHCIIQDSVGLMWFGTDAGLERYDGYEFKVFQINSPFGEQVKVFTILEDWDGERFFWLGTSMGIYKYYPSSKTFSRQNISGLNKKFIKIVVKDHRGVMWFAGAYVLSSYNPETEKVRRYFKNPDDSRGLPSEDIRVIYEDSFQKLWIGTCKGLALYDYNSDTFSGKVPADLDKSSRRLYQFNAIREDKEGNLWMGAWREGLLKYDRKKDVFIRYSEKLNVLNNNYKELLIDENGIIWLAFGGGLSHYNPQTDSYQTYRFNNENPNGISSNNISCLFQDMQGVIWVGTKNNGLDRVEGNSYLFVNYQHELYKGSRMAYGKIKTLIKDDNGTIWVGMNYRELLKIDLQTSKIKKYTLPIPGYGISKSSIFTMQKVNSTFYIMGCKDYGLLRFNPVTEKFSTLLRKIPGKETALSIYTGMRDKHGILWFGLFKTGILRFDPKTRRSSFYPTDISGETKNRILAIIETNSGDLLAATQKSKILKYNPSLDRFEDYYVFKDEIKILDLDEDSRGRLWMATNHSLYMLDTHTDSLSHYTYKQGVSGKVLNSILIDNSEKLWISCNNGIISFDPETNRGILYNHKNGVSAISFRQNTAYRSKDGFLLFGGLGGFTMFKPTPKIKYRSASVMITKSELYINDSDSNDKGLFKQNFAGKKRLELPYDNYGFLFEFSLTDYISPFRNHYKYMLEGGSGQWQDMGGRHSISFVSLAPGKYKLRVKGRNAHGLWSRNEAVAEFEILPPFWQTWWFRLWSLLILILAILAGYQLRVYTIRRRNAELETINKKLNEQINIRRQIERMLTENEIKYRTLVEGIGDGIYTLNAAGIFHFINQIAASRMGGEPSDFTGHSIYDYYPEAVVKPLMILVKKVLGDGISRELDIEIELNGTKKNFNIGIHPLKNELGEITLTLHIAVDTSDRVKLEAQLRQAQKMEAVGNLAGGIAHDFNNLLSVIRGYSFLLLAEENLEETIYNGIKEIDSAGERAQGLTRQLLAFSRKQMLKPKVMNLNTQINGIKTMLSRLIPENIELIYEQSPELNHIFADPGQMEQVLLNLLVNARDAMPLGGRLIVKTENTKLPEKLCTIFKEDKNNLFISLSVADNGMGMTKEVQQKIFDPFFTTKETGKGTGLGLSTVFGIVKQSGGYIWLESAHKKGSTFYIYLPAVNKNVIAEESEKTKTEYPRGHETILVVEDEASVRAMIVKMLGLYGYSTLEAKDGRDGLSVYEQNKDSIDLILSDVVMPGLSGVDLMKKVQEINPRQKILFMSGYTDEEIIKSGMVKRGIRFLQKPFSPDLLMRMLNELFPASTPA